MAVQIAPYGAWKSPISSEVIVGKTIRAGSFVLDGDDVYWLEGRASQGGRNVIMRHAPNGTTSTVTPMDFNVRTLVHEYGGGAFLVADGTIYFSNFADQRLYMQEKGAKPVAITPDNGLRYADVLLDRARNRLICVCEDHRAGGAPENLLVEVPLDGVGEAQPLARGHDFFASPRLSPDGKQLAWLTWDLPNMPWDGTELWVAQLGADGALDAAQKVAGGSEECIFQPEWSPEGELYFVSDRTDWWNLYRVRGGATEAVHSMEAEFGAPQWVFGMALYAFAAPGTIIAAYTRDGRWHLARIDTATGAFTPIQTPYTFIARVQARDDLVYLSAGSPTEHGAIVRLNLGTGETRILLETSQAQIDPKYISIPQAIEFPTENGQTAYGFYYPPVNPDFAAPEGELPPLLVESHGGPTSATSDALNLGMQYWTTRGFGVLDVNYGGSTGYGRAFRNRLRGQWGVVDVDDCVNGALYLSRQGLADEQRLAITGGSAGGYTTLCALTFRNVFSAGASHFGISDLKALLDDSHKFESRDLELLIGPYPERKDLYDARSPIKHAELLNCPVAFFQGLEDKVVPPNQSEMMVNVLRAKGLPVAYVTFEGEQHGFRKAENIRRALDGEFYFYSRVFGFTPADVIEPLVIENLP